MIGIQQKLTDIVGAENIIIAADAIRPYCTDWRGRFHGQAIAVIFPDNAAQIQQLMRVCRDEKLKIIPQGGNTNMVASATPDQSAKNIIINLRRMTRITAIDPNHHFVMVESGCSLAELQDYALRHNRIFPLMLAPRAQCQIGGAIATNAGGLNVIHYGMMRQLVSGIEAVLPDGTIYDGLYALDKNNAGYDLKHLFIGSEGTLGIITKSIVRLYPKPKTTTAIMAAADEFTTVAKICTAIGSEFYGQINAMEYMGRTAWDLAMRFDANLRSPFASPHNHYILLELQDLRVNPDLLPRAHDIIAFIGGASVAAAKNESERQNFWAIRTAIPPAERALLPSIKQDISVPIHHWHDFLTMAESAIAASHPDAKPIYFGHLGDGNLHYNIAVPGLNMDNIAAIESAVNAVLYPIVHQFRGSIAAEHGIGQIRNKNLPDMIGMDNLRLLRGIKNMIDPDNMMNPGKIF